MVDQLATSAEQVDVALDVLVDVDLGRHRNGVVSVQQAVAVADRIAASKHLRFGGMQAYASHISHVSPYDARLRASRVCADVITDVRSALIAAGHNVQRVSGGSTGTLFMDPGLGCYTELQCGSYVFSDVEYGSLDLDEINPSPFEAALFVKVSVIGRNVDGRVTCDGGNKHFWRKKRCRPFASRQWKVRSTAPTATNMALSSCRKARRSQHWAHRSR